MSDSEAKNSTPAEPAAGPGLPPVAPPSGRFILQLFLVPGLIVGLVVCVLLGFQWLMGGPRSPEKFLRELDDPNPEVRWRAAADLAQVLPRDPNLALNVRFALHLSERLRRAVADNRHSEKVRKDQLGQSKDPPKVSRGLQAERDQIWYLIGCLGNFQVPVGAPLLQELALDRDGADPEAVFRRRTQAAYALSVLGYNLRKFDQATAEQRSRAMAALGVESDSDGERGQWALETQAFLEARAAGKETKALRVADTLVKLAGDTAPFLRELSAAGFTYWDNDRAEETLLQLVHDAGAGENPVRYEKEKEDYRKAHPEELRLRNQKHVSYGAALALARRGSERAAGLFDLYEEMLDPRRQDAIWDSDEPSQKGEREASTVQVFAKTLEALNALHAARPEVPLMPVALDHLVESDNQTVRSTALELRNKLR